MQGSAPAAESASESAPGSASVRTRRGAAPSASAASTEGPVVMPRLRTESASTSITEHDSKFQSTYRTTFLSMNEDTDSAAVPGAARRRHRHRSIVVKVGVEHSPCV